MSFEKPQPELAHLQALIGKGLTASHGAVCLVHNSAAALLDEATQRAMHVLLHTPTDCALMFGD